MRGAGIFFQVLLIQMQHIGLRCCFDTMEETVAEYVVRELDYRAGYSGQDGVNTPDSEIV